MRKGLMVFAREPLPGAVKTRLAATVGNVAAAEMYEAMLRDVLSTIHKLCDVETALFWDCAEESLPRLAEKYRCRAYRQSQGDLGQRMQNAFEMTFAAGIDHCCIIGSDAPDLPLSYILEAYRLLEEPGTDVVFGPSLDGGYYLLGMKRLQSQLFSGIPWSSDKVLEQSMTAARNASLKAAMLPEWQDIDTFEDLQAYQGRKKMSGIMENI